MKLHIGKELQKNWAKQLNDVCFTTCSMSRRIIIRYNVHFSLLFLLHCFSPWCCCPCSCFLFFCTIRRHCLYTGSGRGAETGWFGTRSLGRERFDISIQCAQYTCNLSQFHLRYSLLRHFLLWGSSFYWPLSHYPVVGSRIQCSMILLIPIVSLFCFLRIRDNEHMFFHVWLGSYAFEISNCWCLWCFVMFFKNTQKNEQESKRKATQEQEHNDDEEEEEPQTQSHRFVPSI